MQRPKQHNYLIPVVMLLTIASGFAQTPITTQELYTEGVINFKDKKYKIADSLFTLALAISPNGKTYFGRGAARYNFKNVRGYCADMSEASKYGNADAIKQYANKCVIIDTLYSDPKRQTKQEKKVVLEVLVRGIYNDIVIVRPYDKKGVQLAQYFTFKKDTVFTSVNNEFSAKPKGGMTNLSTYIVNGLKYPPQAKDKGVSGTVYIACIINKDGSIGKMKIDRGIGFGCDEEALRLIKAMPKWTNGIYLGKPIKTEVILSVEFNLN